MIVKHTTLHYLLPEQGSFDTAESIADWVFRWFVPVFCFGLYSGRWEGIAAISLHSCDVVFKQIGATRLRRFSALMLNDNKINSGKLHEDCCCRR